MLKEVYDFPSTHDRLSARNYAEIAIKFDLRLKFRAKQIVKSPDHRILVMILGF